MKGPILKITKSPRDAAASRNRVRLARAPAPRQTSPVEVSRSPADADGKLCFEQILSGTTLEFRVEKVGYEKDTESRIINGDVLDWFIVLNPSVSSLLL